MSTLASRQDIMPARKVVGFDAMHILLTGNTTFKLVNFRQGLIRELLCNGHRVTVLSPPDDYVPEIQAMGCDYVALPMDRNGTSVIAEASLLLEMVRCLRKIRPNAVFSYTIKNNIYGGLACRILGIPFVPNVTGLGPAFNKRGLLNATVRLLYTAAFKRAQAVFFQNDNDLALFTDTGLCPTDIAHLLPGSGVDLNQFAARPLPEAPDSSICFLLISRMLWDKGVGQFVEAAREVRRRHPRAHFQLLGPLDPDSRSGIARAQIDAWAADGAVEYLGSVRDVRPFLEAAHCVVLPSYYREGTPRALLEACAMGRPIITTDIPGCRDVVVDGVNGLRIAPSDVAALTSACTLMVEASPDQRAEMGRASRQIAEDRFDEEIVIDAYFQILHALRT
jgi:glycosyltransferase involved in cell wall biosynthesis